MNVLITEKPSVAREFAKVLNVQGKANTGYLESNDWIITWCVGHLVTMSYPEKYDEKYKLWRLDMLPFIPQEFKYEVIEGVKKQYEIDAREKGMRERKKRAAEKQEGKKEEKKEEKNGKKEERELIAKRMLELNKSIEEIIEITGITEEEIDRIKNN